MHESELCFLDSVQESCGGCSSFGLLLGGSKVALGCGKMTPVVPV